MSPVESRTTRYGRPSFCRIASACPTIWSSAAPLCDGCVICTISTLSNWCWRIMPRVSRPALPASERKHGVCDVSRIGRLRLGQELAANAVGERDLRRRDQVLLARRRIAVFGLGAAKDPEHVVPELGQLAGALQDLAIDDVGRVALGVAVLLGLHVEHELGERAMQPRHRPAQEREAGARELDAGLEVEAERRADVDVIARREREFARHAPAPHLDVGVLVGADRNARVGQVRQRHQLLVEVDLDRGEPLGRAIELGADRGDVGHRRAGVAALPLQLADLARQDVALAPAIPRCASAAPCARPRAR